MSRLSFRPRPLDINKKLPLVKSFKEFEDDDTPSSAASTRNSQLLRVATIEADAEVQQFPSKKTSQEIPTPQFSIVDTYERDYSCTFSQPTSYLRGRGARAEIGEFVEYDMDNEDEDWLEEFNKEGNILTPEKFETLLFKLEVLDCKTREKAGVMAPTFGSPIPVLLHIDAAAETLQPQSVRFAVFHSVYNYWKAKRERWQRPILRRLQPPPPVNDTNPYNVFRRREKAHRHHTRRMQRRENSVQSFDKLRKVRHNLDQAKTLLKALIKREAKKRAVVDNEVSLQRIQMKYKIEAQLVEDGMTLPGFTPVSRKFRSSDEDFDSDDTTSGPTRHRPPVRNPHMRDLRVITVPVGRMKRDLKQRPFPNRWLHKQDPLEPVLLFTKPLDPDRLAAAGISRLPDPPVENGSAMPPYHFHGRIGRGGRIIFDRWNQLQRPSPIDLSRSSYVTPSPRPPPPNG